MRTRIGTVRTRIETVRTRIETERTQTESVKKQTACLNRIPSNRPDQRVGRSRRIRRPTPIGSTDSATRDRMRADHAVYRDRRRWVWTVGPVNPRWHPGGRRALGPLPRSTLPTTQSATTRREYWSSKRRPGSPSIRRPKMKRVRWVKMESARPSKAEATGWRRCRCRSPSLMTSRRRAGIGTCYRRSSDTRTASLWTRPRTLGRSSYIGEALVITEGGLGSGAAGVRRAGDVVVASKRRVEDGRSGQCVSSTCPVTFGRRVR